jgi:flagellar biosynthesis/type III secretory pathway protein FliH
MKKFEESPERKAQRKLEKQEKREHKQKVKAAYLKGYNEEEIRSAEERGRVEGKKAGATKGSGGTLATIGRIADGMMKGVNQGADMLNNSMGTGGFDLKQSENELVLPKGDELYMPKGNNDLFFDDEPKPKKRAYQRDW